MLAPLASESVIVNVVVSLLPSTALGRSVGLKRSSPNAFWMYSAVPNRVTKPAVL